MSEKKTEQAAKADKGSAKSSKAQEPKGASAAGKAKAGSNEGSAVPARLQKFFHNELAPRLLKDLNMSSIMEVPRITKITLNMGVGEAVSDKKIVDNAVVDMTKIAGQKPVVTVARIAIANFKVREGFPVGCKVTLRGKRMYEFLDRLIAVAIPRIRDFRGISAKQFDGRGNFSMGINEQIIFPEIEYDKVDKLRGMNIVVTTTARKDEHAKALLSGFSFPFRS